MSIIVHVLRDYPAPTFGGKASALGRLAAAGFDVPPFAVANLVDDALGNDRVAGLEALDAHVGPGPYAVRSSATQEDGAAHSFAGQFLSILGVTRDGLADAIRRVAASGAEPSVGAYRRGRGIAAEGGVAVVVQAMVDPRAAGVMFTADPRTGRRDRVVVSAVAGLADRLVGGEVEGHDYLLDKATGASLAAARGGPLGEADLASLAHVGRAVEAAFGAPQDVEWVLDGARLRLVQARPITTALRPEPVPDAAETILDNSNVVESYPGVVSPLTYSFASLVYARVYRTFFAIVGVSPARVKAAAPVLDNMLSRVDGRVYYNLLNWYRALALVPGFGANRRSMETMMGVSEPLPEAWAGRIAAEAGADGGTHAKARVLARFAWRAVRLPADARDFRRRLDATLAIGPERVAAMSLSELAAEYRRVEAALLDRWDAPLVNDFLCMAAFGGSRRLLERWCGPEGLAYHNDVMIGQGDIVSAEPARRIREMARIAARTPGLPAALAAGDLAAVERDPALAGPFRDYLARFGDRCVQELKLESVPLSEDPAPLLAAIARAPLEEPGRAADGGDRLAGMLRGSPLRLALARAAVGYAKARVRDRENLRFERTRVFGHARRVFMAMGRQLHARGDLDDPRDVLDLTVAELLGLVEGFAVDADPAGTVAFRRSVSEGAAERPDPPERMTVRGPVSLAARAALDVPSGPAPSPTGDPDRSRRGTGCGAGRAEGEARVIRDPRTETLEPGQVLVARHTDPGWIAVFANARAIVVERGSLLSHSAIVAREMGIPCVVGLRDATRWLADGGRIAVDGGSGAVERIGEGIVQGGGQ